MKNYSLVGCLAVLVLLTQSSLASDMYRALDKYEVDVGHTTVRRETTREPADSQLSTGQISSDEELIEYIRSLYREILKRDPDPHGLETWLSGLKNGTHTLASVRQGILDSPEKTIGDWYRELLGRDPDPSGIETWLEAIRAGTHTLASVRQCILDSEEYRLRHGSPGEDSALPVITPPAGSPQQRIVAAAQDLVDRYRVSGSFPYDPLTQGGVFGCAQVATTALKNAGVNIAIDLAVLRTIPKLKALGWREVVVPPYQAGDVVTWSTYDSSGDGRNDPDTHIGIIMQSGNNVQAMSNDSIARRPSIHSVNAFPVTRVLRMA